MTDLTGDDSSGADNDSARPHRLAIITSTGSPWGGSEELWAATARAAMNAGWGVMCSVVEASSPQHEELRQAGLNLQRHRTYFNSSWRVKSATARFFQPLRHVSAFAPDVVLVSQGETYDFVGTDFLYRALTCGALRTVPFIVVCQLNGDAPPAPTTRARAAEFFGRAARVLFVAERNLRQARRQLVDDLRNAAVIRNPVNLDTFDAVSLPEGNTVRRFACVARLETTSKAQDVLLEAFADDRWRVRKWHLSFYGSGRDEQYLRQLASYYGLDSQISFCGHVDSVRSIWAKEEILVLPSRAEGTPLALVEAMICGRPALVTDIAGNTEWIRDGQSGFVCAAPSVESVAEGLERAWQAQGRWPTLGAAARERAIGMFDPDPGRTLLGLLANAAEGTLSPIVGGIGPEPKATQQ